MGDTNKDDDDDLDLDMNFDDDLGFEDEDDLFAPPKPVKDDRKPVIKMADQFASKFKERLLDDQRLIQTGKQILPRNARDLIDLTDGALTQVGSAYRDTVENLKPTLKQFKRSARQFKASLGDVLPESLNKWVDEKLADEDDYSRDVISEEQMRENQIAQTMTEIFQKQEEQDGARAQEEKVYTLTQIQQSGENINLSAKLYLELQKLNRREDTIGINVQKKMLELSMRQWQIQSALLSAFLEHKKSSDESLKLIVKNSALPDIVKEHTKETAKQLLLKRFIEGTQKSISGRLGLSTMVTNYINRASKAINEKVINNLKDGLGMVGELFNMLGTSQMDPETMAMMGQAQIIESDRDKALRGLAGFAGESAAEQVHNRTAKWAHDKLMEFEAVKRLSEFMRYINQRGGYVLNNFSKNGVDIKDDDNLATQWLKKALNYSRDFLDLSSEAVSERGGSYNHFTTKSMHSPTEFTNFTQKSITEIIPGYLARILQSTEAIRTGKVSGLVTFSAGRDRFLTQEEHEEDLRTRLNAVGNSLGYSTESAVRQLAGKDFDVSKDLTDDDKRAMMKYLTRMWRRGREFKFNEFINDKNLKISDELKAKITKNFREETGLAEDGTLPTESEKLAKLNDIYDSINRGVSSLPLYVNEIVNMSNEGVHNTDTFKKMGIMERHGWDDHNILSENVYDFLIESQLKDEKDWAKNRDERRENLNKQLATGWKSRPIVTAATTLPNIPVLSNNTQPLPLHQMSMVPPTPWPFATANGAAIPVSMVNQNSPGNAIITVPPPVNNITTIQQIAQDASDDDDGGGASASSTPPPVRVTRGNRKRKKRKNGKNKTTHGASNNTPTQPHGDNNPIPDIIRIRDSGRFTNIIDDARNNIIRIHETLERLASSPIKTEVVNLNNVRPDNPDDFSNKVILAITNHTTAMLASLKILNENVGYIAQNTKPYTPEDGVGYQPGDIRPDEITSNLINWNKLARLTREGTGSAIRFANRQFRKARLYGRKTKRFVKKHILTPIVNTWDKLTNKLLAFDLYFPDNMEEAVLKARDFALGVYCDASGNIIRSFKDIKGNVYRVVNGARGPIVATAEEIRDKLVDQWGKKFDITRYTSITKRVFLGAVDFAKKHLKFLNPINVIKAAKDFAVKTYNRTKELFMQNIYVGDEQHPRITGVQLMTGAFWCNNKRLYRAKDIVGDVYDANGKIVLHLEEVRNKGLFNYKREPYKDLMDRAIDNAAFLGSASFNLGRAAVNRLKEIGGGVWAGLSNIMKATFGGFDFSLEINAKWTRRIYEILAWKFGGQPEHHIQDIENDNLRKESRSLKSFFGNVKAKYDEGKQAWENREQRVSSWVDEAVKTRDNAKRAIVDTVDKFSFGGKKNTERLREGTARLKGTKAGQLVTQYTSEVHQYLRARGISPDFYKNKKPEDILIDLKDKGFTITKDLKAKIEDAYREIQDPEERKKRLGNILSGVKEIASENGRKGLSRVTKFLGGKYREITNKNYNENIIGFIEGEFAQNNVTLTTEMIDKLRLAISMVNITKSGVFHEMINNLTKSSKAIIVNWSKGVIDEKDVIDIALGHTSISKLKGKGKKDEKRKKNERWKSLEDNYQSQAAQRAASRGDAHDANTFKGKVLGGFQRVRKMVQFGKSESESEENSSRIKKILNRYGLTDNKGLSNIFKRNVWVLFSSLSKDIHDAFNKHYAGRYDSLIKTKNGEVYFNLKKFVKLENERLKRLAKDRGYPIGDHRNNEPLGLLGRMKLRAGNLLKRQRNDSQTDADPQHSFFKGIFDKLNPLKRRGGRMRTREEEARRGRFGKFIDGITDTILGRKKRESQNTNKTITQRTREKMKEATSWKGKLLALIGGIGSALAAAPTALAGILSKTILAPIMGATGILKGIWNLGKGLILGRGTGFMGGAGNLVRGAVVTGGKVIGTGVKFVATRLASAAVTLVTTPAGWAILGLAAAGYGAYKLWKWYRDSFEVTDKYRLATYGLHAEGNIAKGNVMLAFEREMESVYPVNPKTGQLAIGGRMEWNKWAALFWDTDLMGDLDKTRLAKEQVPRFKDWFNYRFLPNYKRHREAFEKMRLQSESDAMGFDCDGIWDIDDDMNEGHIPSFVRMTHAKDDNVKIPGLGIGYYEYEGLPFADQDVGGMTAAGVNQVANEVYDLYGDDELRAKAYSAAKDILTWRDKNNVENGKWTWEKEWEDGKLVEQKRADGSAEWQVSDKDKSSLKEKSEKGLLIRSGEKMTVSNSEGKSKEIEAAVMAKDLGLENNMISDWQYFRLAMYGLDVKQSTKEDAILFLSLERDIFSNQNWYTLTPKDATGLDVWKCQEKFDDKMVSDLADKWMIKFGYDPKDIKQKEAWIKIFLDRVWFTMRHLAGEFANAYGQESDYQKFSLVTIDKWPAELQYEVASETLEYGDVKDAILHKTKPEIYRYHPMFDRLAELTKVLASIKANVKQTPLILPMDAESREKLNEKVRKQREAFAERQKAMLDAYRIGDTETGDKVKDEMEKNGEIPKGNQPTGSQSNTSSTSDSTPYQTPNNYGTQSSSAYQTPVQIPSSVTLPSDIASINEAMPQGSSSEMVDHARDAYIAYARSKGRSEQDITAAIATTMKEAGVGSYATLGPERMGYSYDNMMSQYGWKSRIAKWGGDPNTLVKNPEGLANVVYMDKYGATLGNTQEGDGWKFRGRGLIGLTGRDNYTKYGKILGVDLVNNPDIALTPGFNAMFLDKYLERKGAYGKSNPISSISRAVLNTDVSENKAREYASKAAEFVRESNNRISKFNLPKSGVPTQPSNQPTATPGGGQTGGGSAGDSFNVQPSGGTTEPTAPTNQTKVSDAVKPDMAGMEQIPGNNPQALPATPSYGNSTPSQIPNTTQAHNTPTPIAHPVEDATPVETGSATPMAIKAAQFARKNALPKSTGRCAMYVRMALEHAGYRFTRKGSAYMYNDVFQNEMKWAMVGRGYNVTPQIGDVMVLPAHGVGSGGGIHGHIQIWDGKNWISDFVQRTNKPNGNYDRVTPTMWRDANGKKVPVDDKKTDEQKPDVIPKSDEPKPPIDLGGYPMNSQPQQAPKPMSSMVLPEPGIVPVNNTPMTNGHGFENTPTRRMREETNQQTTRQDTISLARVESLLETQNKLIMDGNILLEKISNVVTKTDPIRSNNTNKETAREQEQKSNRSTRSIPEGKVTPPVKTYI